MNVVELIMLAVLIPILLEFKARRNSAMPAWREKLSYVCVAVSALAAGYHSLLMDNRWPVWLVYGVIAWSLYRVIVFRIGKAARLSITGGKKTYILLAVAAAFVMYLFPMFTIPEPTGQYPVGTTTRYLMDPAREETMTDDPSDKRELMLRVWYPAAVEPSHEPKPLTFFDVMNTMLQEDGYPQFIYGFFDQVKTHSLPEAPVNRQAEPYPVIVFSHGFAGLSSQSLFLVEELASQGYVVVGIDHTYMAAVTEFPDGRVIPLKAGIMDEFERTKQSMAAIWAKDASFVLDELGRMNQSDPMLAGMLDLNRAGMMGHSFGGSSTLLTLSEDGRFRAGLAMDAPVSGIVQPMSLSQPFMFYEAGLSQLDLNQKKALFKAFKGDGYMLTLKGANHDSFTNYPLESRLFASIFIDKYKAYRLINEYTLAFFNQYLKNESSSLLHHNVKHSSKITFMRN